MADKSGFARRDFLQAGAVTVAVPGFLAACANERAAVKPAELAAGASSSYFEQRFGVTKENINRVMAAALSRGGGLR